jgi:glycerophosphoryl diester phosphodiesterase
MDVVVEMKPCPGRAKATTMVTMFEMSKVWPEKDRLPVISSFDVESLEIAAQLEPHWPRCLLLDSWTEDWQALFEQVKGSAIAMPEAVLSPERVDQLNHLRIPLLAYTVNDPQRAKELLAWGVAAVYAGSPRAILDAL